MFHNSFLIYGELFCVIKIPSTLCPNLVYLEFFFAETSLKSILNVSSDKKTCLL